MSAGAVVVDADAGVVFHLGEGTHHVADAFLHLGVGALHGVELYGIVIFAGLYGGYGAAAHTDAVVVAAHYHYFHSGFGLTLDGVFQRAGTYAAGQHDNLVIGQDAVVFLMLEG